MRIDRPQRKPQPPAPLLVGTRLGEFDVRAVLGLGQYGFVYRVWDPESETEYAVKEYLPQRLAVRDGAKSVAPRSPADAEAFAQGLRFFVDEGKLLSQVRHPALVHVYGAWEENGTAYMAMDLVPGRNLHHTLQARGRPPREGALRAWLDDLLGALEALHLAGLQHRDVAPPSIVVGPDNRPVLMDLGTPRRMATSRGEAGPAGARDGFAAIEQYGNGHGLKRGPWTDVYALGAVLHLLMTGKPPAPAPQRATSAGAATLAWAPATRQRYGLYLLATVEWMLSPQPRDRPQNVDAVRAVLADPTRVPARLQPGLGARLGMQLRRHRRWLWSLLALLVLAGLAFAAWRLAPPGLLTRLRLR
jgi:serine/threonine protein kinase